MIKIYNSLTRKKDILKPRNGKKINFFVCGPTVYDYSHIGHARTYIIFDAFVKYLRRKGLKVFYLQNITDLDDKIIGRAREKGVPAKDLAIAFEKEYLKDMKKLGITSVNKYARATDYIKEIIYQIQRLKKKGFAYEIENDGVYFDISKFKKYGKLAGRTVIDAEDAISRIDYSAKKNNRGDFCLWKISAPNEPSWKSPFGLGRPGWHIEDTAITEKFFGPQYDIHGGARDIIFPHHEAEIAQMESASGKSPLVKYWMHTGFLTINGQKMSKSLGNFITISDFLKRCSPNCLRFFIEKNLWRSPIDYSESAIIEAKSSINKVEEFLRKVAELKKKKQNNSKLISKNLKLIKIFIKNFYAQLDDDFNTPKAFAAMFDFIRTMNELIEKNMIAKKESELIFIFFQEINSIFEFIDFKKINKKIPAEIRRMAKQREEYRKNKDWQKSDQIRIEIERQGYAIEDTPTGSFIKSI